MGLSPLAADEYSWLHLPIALLPLIIIKLHFIFKSSLESLFIAIGLISPQQCWPNFVDKGSQAQKGKEET